nr:hypothetical protein [uncultured bacterium]
MRHRGGHDRTRRQILKATLVGAGWLAGCHPPMPMTELSGDFPLGVASGDITSSSVLVWTRYLRTDPLELIVWKGAPEGANVVVAQPVVSIEKEGVVRLVVDDLAPDTRYTFAFYPLIDGQRGAPSELGNFRTAPAADVAAPLVVAATSCTRLGYPMTVLERAAARRDLDLFLMLGDNTYADDATTLTDYRRYWEATLVEPGQRALRAALPIISTWDDHEFENNWSFESIDPKRFDAAARAFFEHVPARRDPVHPERIWRSFRWGKTAEFFVVDSRGERRPSTRESASPEYISRAQMDWLKAGLSASDAVFKVIVNSVPIAQYGGVLFDRYVADRWEGYPVQRDEILKHIDDNVRGALWIGGDFHLASMGYVSRDGPGKDAIEVLVGPGANAQNPSPSYPRPPQFMWASGVNNYTTFSFNPAAREVRVTFFDAGDSILADRTFTL